MKHIVGTLLAATTLLAGGIAAAAPASAATSCYATSCNGLDPSKTTCIAIALERSRTISGAGSCAITA